MEASICMIETSLVFNVQSSANEPYEVVFGSKGRFLVFRKQHIQFEGYKRTDRRGILDAK